MYICRGIRSTVYSFHKIHNCVLEPTNIGREPLKQFYIIIVPEVIDRNNYVLRLGEPHDHHQQHSEEVGEILPPPPPPLLGCRGG